jgi:lipoate-protein ligase A
MEKWRYMVVDWLSYAETAVYRPVLLRSVMEGLVPNTVSVFRFSKPSLVMSYFNDPEKEINLEFCRSKGIPVYRIISSGGAAFGDKGYMVTFLHVDRENPKIPPDVLGMFQKTLTGLAAGFSDYFKMECRFRPLNDLEVKCNDGLWRKIGPSSCVYEQKAVQMASGIQVKEPDKDLMAKTIPAAPEKFADKTTKTVQDRITSLEKAVGRPVEMDELKIFYKNQIEKIFQVELIPGELTEKEKTYYDEMKAKYTSKKFLMERSESKFGPVPPDVIRKAIQFKVPQGPFVRIVTLTKDNRVVDILISGTIHASPLTPTSPIQEIEKALKGQPIDAALFNSRIEEVLNRPNFDFPGVASEFLAEKIYSCATQ